MTEKLELPLLCKGEIYAGECCGNGAYLLRIDQNYNFICVYDKSWCGGPACDIHKVAGRLVTEEDIAEDILGKLIHFLVWEWKLPPNMRVEVEKSEWEVSTDPENHPWYDDISHLTRITEVEIDCV